MRSPASEQPPHHVVGSDDPAALKAASRRRLRSHSCALAVICFLDELTMAEIWIGYFAERVCSLPDFLAHPAQRLGIGAQVRCFVSALRNANTLSIQ